jgi:CBS-domain-containing membrane protein
MLQLIAAAASLIGILLTIVAAVRASNPTVPIVIAVAGAIVLVVAAYRENRG